MIVIRVELHSAITRKVTEIARMRRGALAFCDMPCLLQ